jgi:hypothetical protein
MLNTEEAKAMTPDVTTTWMDKVKAEVSGYASYNLFKKTTKNGNTKGIPRKV